MSSNGRTYGVVGRLALAMMLAVTACGSSAKAPRSSGGPVAGPVITVCSEVPNRPMEYDGPGPRGVKYTGFDIELFDAMAQRLNRKIDVRAVAANPFDQIFGHLSGTASPSCDVIVSSVTITAPRRQVVAFTDPYFDVAQSLLVRRGSGVRSVGDLAGKTVGVEIGGTGPASAPAHLPAGVVIKGFADTTGLLGALTTGSIQAVYQDLPANASLVIEDKSVMIVATFSTSERYGFAVRKDRTALVGQLNTALAQVRADGTYQALYSRYFRRA